MAFQTEEEAIEDVADHVVWDSVHGKMMKELAFEKGKELVSGERYVDIIVCFFGFEDLVG